MSDGMGLGQAGGDRVFASLVAAFALVGCDSAMPSVVEPVVSPAGPVSTSEPVKLLTPPIALVDAYPRAELNSNAAVETPSGHGSFIANAWPTSTGDRNSIIVLTGFDLTMPPVRLGATNKLTFDAGMAYPSSAAAKLWVSIRSGSEVVRVWEENAVPPKAKTVLKSYTVDLTPYAHKDAQLVFGMSTPVGDSSGHWAVFADAKVE